MSCPRCQATVSPHARFCNACGHQLQVEQLEAKAGMRMLLPVGRSGWAIAAGYAGLFGLLVFPAPLALILGVIAAMHLRRRRDLHGWGRTVFGLLMGAVGTVVLLLVALSP